MKTDTKGNDAGKIKSKALEILIDFYNNEKEPVNLSLERVYKELSELLFSPSTEGSAKEEVKSAKELELIKIQAAAFYFTGKLPAKNMKEYVDAFKAGWDASQLYKLHSQPSETKSEQLSEEKLIELYDKYSITLTNEAHKRGRYLDFLHFKKVAKQICALSIPSLRLNPTLLREIFDENIFMSYKMGNMIICGKEEAIEQICKLSIPQPTQQISKELIKELWEEHRKYIGKCYHNNEMSLNFPEWLDGQPFPLPYPQQPEGAKEEAILRFAEWTHSKGYSYNWIHKDWHNPLMDKTITTSELFTLFKNQK